MEVIQLLFNAQNINLKLYIYICGYMCIYLHQALRILNFTFLVRELSHQIYFFWLDYPWRIKIFD